MSCGRVGHFPKMCRTKGKPPKKEEAAGKKDGCDCRCPVRSTAPDISKSLPLEPTEENIKKLETWIKNYYESSAFNCCECQPLPKMHGEPLKIHMKEGAQLVASHSIPYTGKQKLRPDWIGMRQLE